MTTTTARDSLGGCPDLAAITPVSAASWTSSARDPDRIFSITRARCTLTVFSTTQLRRALFVQHHPGHDWGEDPSLARSRATATGTARWARLPRPRVPVTAT
jgi:hypothetical protein